MKHYCQATLPGNIARQQKSQATKKTGNINAGQQKSHKTLLLDNISRRKKPGTKKDGKHYCRVTKKTMKHYCQPTLPGNKKARQQKSQATKKTENIIAGQKKTGNIIAGQQKRKTA